MSEWLKELDSKSSLGATPTWVRIPLSPPNFSPEKFGASIVDCRLSIFFSNFEDLSAKNFENREPKIENRWF
jgi:hypothetical protein